jgi:hypothetical protein
MLPTEIIFRLDDHDSAVAMISESFPHMVEVDSVNHRYIIDFLLDNFGKSARETHIDGNFALVTRENQKWEYWSSNGHYWIMFVNEADAVLFKLGFVNA